MKLYKMKKITGILFVALLLCAKPVTAQVKLGVKGGLNLSSVSLSGQLVDNLSSKNQTGFFIGPMLDIHVPIIGLGVDAALLFNQVGVNLKGNNVDETVKEKSLQIPLNVKYSIGLGSLAGVYFAAGPQFGFNIDNKKASEVLDEATDGDFFKSSVVSANIGAGLKLVNHLQLGINYNFPFGKNAKATDSNGNKSGSVKAKTWQVSVAYIF